MPEDPPAAPPPSRVFAARLVSTLVLWALIGSALAFRVEWPLVLVVALFGILGTWEYVRLVRPDSGARAYGNLLLAVTLAYWAAASFFAFRSRAAGAAASSGGIPLWIDLAALLVMVQGVFALALRGPLEGEVALRRMLGALGGFLFTTFPGAFFLRLIFFNESGAHLLLLTILVVKFGDMGAYAFGSLFGRHKMIPHISPKKTWEGFGGAVVTSLAAFAGMMSLEQSHLPPLNWGSGFGFALVLCLVGVHGDLAESVLKRCHGIKDSGHTLPGIGGILDLTDSLLFAAPVAWFYLKAIS